MGAISGLKLARLITCSRWAENALVWFQMPRNNNTPTGVKVQVLVVNRSRSDILNHNHGDGHQAMHPRRRVPLLGHGRDDTGWARRGLQEAMAIGVGSARGTAACEHRQGVGQSVRAG